jgi:adenosylmethionine-8-amino-7-oxononanoate aminotransferase
MISANAIFPRNFKDEYPFAERGEGVHLYDDTGKQYLDACGGSAVVTIGHGVQEIVEQTALQSRSLAYCHSSQFNTRVEAELAQLLAERFPGAPQNARVHFTSGGSESTETAIKIIRQYWLARRQPCRTKLVSRWQGYHGTTLGALAVSGNRQRRDDYQALLADVAHISPCFCYHCWLNQEFPSCELACARELESTIDELGTDEVAAFFFEPVVGATSGAVPTPGYLERLRDICKKKDVLLVADEVMTGAGRTGKYFAVEHWNIEPDLILLGKGLSSGYAPLGAVLVSEKVWRTIADASLTLQHGFTYQAHPPSVAAGLAVQKYLIKHDLIERARETGEYLATRLETLRSHDYVGDIRGKGMLQVVEFVQDRASRSPFPSEARVAKRIFSWLRSQGLLVYPGTGTADGVLGDHILIAPPFIIERSDIDWLVQRIGDAVAAICGSAVREAQPFPIYHPASQNR